MKTPSRTDTPCLIPTTSVLAFLQIPKAARDTIPLYPTRAFLWTEKDVSAYTVVPFQQAFPLELFEIIIAHADLAAISRTARASFACYELFMPVLLQHLYVASEEELRQMFVRTDMVRLECPSQALAHATDRALSVVPLLC